MGGKYSTYSQKQEPTTRKQETHPIWRGIGFAFMILIPILGWFGALYALDQRWVPTPADLLVRWQDPMILIKVILALVIMFVLFAVFQMVAFILRRIFGAPRYGPYDVPNVTYRGKHHKR